jgi:dipeptidyl aminopeptidase/acylaminoacyl peptidase
VSLPKVAAIVNWFGITDVADLLEGANRKPYAVAWFGSMPEREEIARRVAPLSYIRSDLPPIMTIHGDADPTVPYQHALRLHEGLTKAGVPNQLLTIPGGKHGHFTNEERVRVFRAIREFLAKCQIIAENWAATESGRNRGPSEDRLWSLSPRPRGRLEQLRQ